MIIPHGNPCPGFVPIKQHLCVRMCMFVSVCACETDKVCIHVCVRKPWCFCSGCDKAWDPKHLSQQYPPPPPPRFHISTPLQNHYIFHCRVSLWHEKISNLQLPSFVLDPALSRSNQGTLITLLFNACTPDAGESCSSPPLHCTHTHFLNVHAHIFFIITHTHF